MRVYKLIRAEAGKQMSRQASTATTAAASAPAREPETQPTEPRGGQPAAPNASESRNAQTGGRTHPRRHRRSGGGSGSSGGGERGGEQREREPQSRTAQPERELNLDELRELSELLNAQGFNEFEIEREGLRLRLSRYPSPPPIQPPTSAQAFVPPAVTPVAESGAATQATTGTTMTAPAAETKQADASADEGLHMITSPIVVTPVAESGAATQATTGTTTTAPAAETKQADASADEGLHMITSPIVGTFYRSPSPTAEPFVSVGSHVEEIGRA